MSSMHRYDDFDKIVEEQFPKEHCEASSTEIVEIFLPEEVWIIIWSKLDFNIVQKICTRVSKSWLKSLKFVNMKRVKDFRYPTLSCFQN